MDLLPPPPPRSHGKLNSASLLPGLKDAAVEGILAAGHVQDVGRGTPGPALVDVVAGPLQAS